eukprot:7703605-Lingulodinium_polyedra.AAC.1
MAFSWNPDSKGGTHLTMCSSRSPDVGAMGWRNFDSHSCVLLASVKEDLASRRGSMQFCVRLSC